MTPVATIGSASFLEGYDRLRDGFARVGPEWVAGLRAENRERFERQGLPGTADEAWRFTGLKALRKTAFPFRDESNSGPGEMPPLASGDTECSRLVFVNGVYAPEWSLGGNEGCPETSSLAQVLRTEPDSLRNRLGSLADTARHRFAALNTAFVREGAVVRVPAGTWAGRIQVVFVTLPRRAPHATYPRVLVILEDGAEAILAEEYLGAQDADGAGTSGAQPGVGAATFAAPVTEVFLGRNAGLTHYRFTRESAGGIHLGLLAVHQGRDSRYANHAFALGGKLLRLDVDLTLAGEGAEAVLNGLYLTSDREHVDHHTRVDHAAPHTQSRELYKGVLDGKSTAVFNGRVVIRPAAQKVDAGQVNKNLLLSDEALVNTNPELEIFADDVKAQHGATVGQIEEESLFYLRSRGIPETESRRLLIEAFAGEMIERVSAPPIRERLQAELARRFGANGTNGMAGGGGTGSAAP